MTLEISREEIGSIAAKAHHVSPRWAVVPLVLLDAACIASSMVVAYRARFHWLEYRATISMEYYTYLIIIATAVWLVIFGLYKLYTPRYLFGGLEEYARTLNACSAGLATLVLYSFLHRGIAQDLSRGWLVIVWLLTIPSVAFSRFCYRRLIYSLRENGLFTRRALLIGANQEGKAVSSQLRASKRAGVEAIGFVDPGKPPGTTVDGIPVLGNLSNLGTLIERFRVTELILIPTALQREDLLNIYRDWGTNDNVCISLSSGLYELLTTGVQVREIGFVPFMVLNQTRISGPDALIKQALDYTVALVGLLFLIPLLLVLAPLVWLDSPGPLIYRRRVIGLRGRQFDAFKIRTMIQDADTYMENHPDLKEEWERTGKIHDDPRVTPLGRFLRRYSLDELPQLINVLMGQMSLVGPRMITPAELKHFGHWRHNLLTVKPGLTGLWQVTGRADLSYAERVQLDMQYIRNYTIWLDLKLMIETIRVVINGRGAY